jgi:cold shock CspA family protein
MQGEIVRWFSDRHFGFIKPMKGEHDLFFHRSAVLSGEPRAGASVEYHQGRNEPFKDTRGRSVALKVKVLT